MSCTTSFIGSLHNPAMHNGALGSMDSLFNVEVVLENDSSVYKAGDILSGAVHIVNKQKLQVREVRLTLKGACDIRWKELMEDDSGKTEVEHCAQEIYFEENLELWESSDDVGCAEDFSAGRHLFPFSFELPENLPCSFEGSNGWIRYSATACISSADKKDFESTAFFTILRELDFSSINEKEDERQVEEESILRSSCCTAGRINCSLNVSCRFLVPGQQLQAHVDVKNLSSRKVKSCCVLFMQTVTYYTRSGRGLRVRRELHKIPGKCVKPGKRQSWTCGPLDVPALPPSDLQPCRFIRLAYHLVLRLSSLPNPAEIAVPLVVGTVPQSFFLHSGWAYASESHKGKSLSDTDPTTKKSPDEIRWLPKYRTFRALSPMHSIDSLMESPGLRRRIHLDIQNNESVV